MNLLDFLFGKKKTINDPVLGIIKSERIKGENHTKSYTWYAGYLIPNALEKSSVVMQGNNREPNPAQLTEIKYILHNLDSLYLKVDEKLAHEAKNQTPSEREAFKNWRNFLFLGAIHPANLDTSLNFELGFDPIDVKSNGYMSFTYSNREIIEMDGEAPK
ncbi:hypothetical protein [Zobellia uliginosa]|uniref:hypothetical protein n=1 Tax=Zobellia uliginosa TaxID=143224 RepID=UPI001C06F712|nr:hypothetical protein [Zobellia uliginosa]MBU2947415.1 hypothetical protein [Zobellia uliginosa]